LQGVANILPNDVEDQESLMRILGECAALALEEKERIERSLLHSAMIVELCMNITRGKISSGPEPVEAWSSSPSGF
jgi:hypothetical protein